MLTARHKQEIMRNPTAAYKLFHHQIPVKIKTKFIIHPDMRKYRPGMTDPDPDVEKALREELLSVYKTPVAIINYYDRGIDCTYVNLEDKLKIYRWICEHLNDWAEVLGNPISGAVAPPAEELLLFEQYAHSIADGALFIEGILDAGRHDAPRSALDELFAMFGGRKRSSSTADQAEVPKATINPSDVGQLNIEWDAYGLEGD